MKRIVLACSAGMSTSLLVTKMRKATTEDIEIYAIPEAKVREELEITNGEIDCILLGPQVRFLKDEVVALAAPYNIPVEVIEMMHYGMCNGPEVLKFAKKLVDDNAK